VTDLVERARRDRKVRRVRLPGHDDVAVRGHRHVLRKVGGVDAAKIRRPSHARVDHEEAGRLSALDFESVAQRVETPVPAGQRMALAGRVLLPRLRQGLHDRTERRREHQAAIVRDVQVLDALTTDHDLPQVRAGREAHVVLEPPVPLVKHQVHAVLQAGVCHRREAGNTTAPPGRIVAEEEVVVTRQGLVRTERHGRRRVLEDEADDNTPAWHGHFLSGCRCAARFGDTNDSRIALSRLDQLKHERVWLDAYRHPTAAGQVSGGRRPLALVLHEGQRERPPCGVVDDPIPRQRRSSRVTRRHRTQATHCFPAQGHAIALIRRGATRRQPDRKDHRGSQRAGRAVRAHRSSACRA